MGRTTISVDHARLQGARPSPRRTASSATRTCRCMRSSSSTRLPGRHRRAGGARLPGGPPAAPAQCRPGGGAQQRRPGRRRRLARLPRCRTTIWLPDKLGGSIPATADDKVGLVAGRVAGRRDAAFDPAPDFDALWARNTVATSSWCAPRRPSWRPAAWRRTCPPCEDYNLWLRLAATGWRVVMWMRRSSSTARRTKSLTRNLIRFADRERACHRGYRRRLRPAEDRIHRRVAGAYHAPWPRRAPYPDMRAARRLLLAALRHGPTARRAIDLAAAAMPPAMLNLRRRLVHCA